MVRHASSATPAIPAIAVLTAAVIRAVTENQASCRNAPPTSAQPQHAESAPTSTRPVTPAIRAVPIACATSRPTPAAEAMSPRRSRAAAISGAPIGLLSAARCTLRPRTPL